MDSSFTLIPTQMSCTDEGWKVVQEPSLRMDEDKDGEGNCVSVQL